MSHTQRAACGVRRAACGVRRAACGVRRAACGVRRAACGVRRAHVLTKNLLQYRSYRVSNMAPSSIDFSTTHVWSTVYGSHDVRETS